MRRTTFLVPVAAAALVLTSCSAGGDPGSNGSTESLTVAVVTPPTSFVPGNMPLGGPEATYYEPVYDTLFNLDSNGEEVANLVQEWSWNDSLTALTLDLREGVTFSDGTAFDAAAVKANIEATKAGTGASAQAFRSVTTVDVADDTTAVINLSAPDPALEPNLARSPGYMVSPTTIGSADAATNPVGTGPYVLDADQSTPGDTYVYTRNESYWNADAYPFNQIDVRYVDDTTALINALRSGQIDATSGGSAEVVSGAEEAGLNVLEYTNGAVEGMFLWDRDGALVPALADQRVRQAINYAIDRDTIVETVKAGLGQATVQPFSEASGAYVAELEERYPYDLDKAKQLMADAGYADGFSMTLPDFSPVYPNEQAAMTEALAALNITVEYQSITGDQAVGNIIQGLYPANYFQLSSSNPWDLAQLTMAPQAVFNPFKTADPEVESLLAEIQNSTGEDQTSKLKELNEYVTDQAWFALWSFALGTFVTTDAVTATPVAGVNVPPLYTFAPAQ